MLSALNSSTAPIVNAYNNRNTEFNNLFSEAKSNVVSRQNIQPDWIPELQRLARSPEWNETVGDYVMRTHPGEMAFLRDQYQKRTLLLEEQENQRPVKNDYKSLNTSFADLEARASGINANSKAVFVGSGPQPNTVLSYANYANAVTGIDINPDAIEATRSIAANSGGKIDFALSRGEEFNYGPYSHVGIAVMVPDKERILRQIQRTAQPGCIVIVRSVDGLKNAMYEGLNSASLKGFDKVATVHGTDHNITNAVILRKKPLNIVA